MFFNVVFALTVLWFSSRGPSWLPTQVPIVAPGVLHASTCAVLLYCTCHHIASCSVPFVSIRRTLCLWKTWCWDQTTQNLRRRHLDKFSSHLAELTTSDDLGLTQCPQCQVVPAPGRRALHWKLGGPKLAGNWATSRSGVPCAVPNGITWSFDIYHMISNVLLD